MRKLCVLQGIAAISGFTDRIQVAVATAESTVRMQ